MTTTEQAAVRYHVTGMDCTSCVAKIEGAARKVSGVEEVKVSLTSQAMTLRVDNPALRLPEVERTITGLGYKLDRLGAARKQPAIRYHVTGMDCTSCVTKIEGTTRKIPGVEDVKVSLTSQVMTLQVDDAPLRLPEIERTITGLGYKLSRLDTAEAGSNDEGTKDHSHTTPAYRRALWIVVLLNVAMGLAEIAAGFIADSQALKADALDFLGDGSITFLGLIAIGWNLVWRSRAAFLQGLFLGVLGIVVLVSTGFRVLVLNQPEAEIMGLFGIIACMVNVAAAFVLMPHRAGDANMRAVWLFSRNDAIGNLAVVAAAVLVAWTATPWPDLAVAAVVAGLFLHSSWEILKDARSEMRSAGAPA